MAYEDKVTTAHRAHNVIMEGRARLAVSGVTDVTSFDEQEIACITNVGNLIVRGSDLHIDKLDLENGDLNITGTITDLSYEEVARTGSLWSRIFG